VELEVLRNGHKATLKAVPGEITERSEG